MNKSYNSADCKTIGGEDENKQCIFPFTYDGVKYTACTTANHTRFWCSTEVNVNGRFIKSKWGDCGPGCSKEEKIPAIGILIDIILGVYCEKIRNDIN